MVLSVATCCDHGHYDLVKTSIYSKLCAYYLLYKLYKAAEAIQNVNLF